MIPSATSVVMTLAGGTSARTIAGPLAFLLDANGFLTNLPSTYQPEREWSVRMRFSPIFCEEEISRDSITSNSFGTVLRSLSQSLASWVLSTIIWPGKISTCLVLLCDTSLVSRSARTTSDIKHSMWSILYFLLRRYSSCSSDSVKQ